ncbi:MAG: ferritin-like domain-containing protein [Bacteroidota bacterium]|nr:ferritin-like domain-containing protein [Bacteroidota bacterium]
MKNASRSALISLLSEACELEHGLACSYLYAAFTLKLSVSENDLTWQEFQSLRIWAGQLYFIASQEMMHLSQAWNLLTAIGGTPYYMRPNFPQGHKYYPIGLPLKLEPFGRRALKRFTFYELPSHVSDTAFLEKEFRIKLSAIEKAFTVGKLYTEIRACFNAIPQDELFIGDKSLQVGADICHFNEIVKVTDRESANRAIDTIMEQGEGNSNDQVDCHYGLFVRLDKELDQLEQAARARSAKFEPARPAIEDPITSFDRNIGPQGAHKIEDPYTNDVAILFDNVYSLMLRMLQYVFQSGPLPADGQRRFAEAAIQIMARALKPLGEALTLLPAGPSYPGKTAGPAFGLYRHVSLPADFNAATIMVNERFEELIAEGRKLSTHPKAPAVLLSGISKLEDIANRLMFTPKPITV